MMKRAQFPLTTTKGKKGGAKPPVRPFGKKGKKGAGLPRKSGNTY
jgi:hypothetical protein